MQDVATAVHLLPIRVDTIEKAPGVFLQHVADARGLNDVDPDVAWIAHARTPDAARRVARGSGGRARCAGAPGPRPRVKSRADQRRRGTGRVRERATPRPRDRTRGALGNPAGRYVRAVTGRV